MQIKDKYLGPSFLRRHLLILKLAAGKSYIERSMGTGINGLSLGLPRKKVPKELSSPRPDPEGQHPRIEGDLGINRL